MRHYGDITKLSGYILPPVDCITGGSPCQDLSVGGKGAGLSGERSRLFVEQIRIVREMRERDRMSAADYHSCPRPRYMVWENVPGALNSNGGRDFQTVLTMIVRIAEPEAPEVPMPGAKGWPRAGCVYSGEGKWSVAWRVHDAQYWGVPQRRKRIALVADFQGMSAPEVLFERKGTCLDVPLAMPYKESADEGGSPICIEGNGARESHKGDGYRETQTMYTLNTVEQHAVLPGDGYTVYNGENITCPTNRAMPMPGDPCHTLTTDNRNYLCPPATNGMRDGMPAVRRLTLLECERLQGFPDGWTDIGEWTDSRGKKRESSASARYEALGNSIAQPYWFFLLRRISAQYERPATLGSLFDGISGFPLAWARANGPKYCLWASEIEEFPIAVCKRHFGDEETGEKGDISEYLGCI